MERLPSPDEAVALSRLVQDVLARPSEAEDVFLGLSLQAQFGVSLLGADPAALASRAREFPESLFLLDSSTLIPYLARSSIGYKAARLLIHALVRTGARVATTYLLGIEVAEHARWALHQLETESLVSTRGFKIFTGRAGHGPNAFLDGLTEEVSKANRSGDLLAYLRDVCDLEPGSKNVGDRDVQRVLEAEGIPCRDFKDFEGFSDDLLVEREELAEKIGDRRKQRGTFRHERQVRAEAEAMILVQGVRRQELGLSGDSIANSFFISHTRVIDAVAGPGASITIRPDSLLQWVNSLVPCATEELTTLFSLLRWELADRDLEVVDHGRIQFVFGGLVNASKRKLSEETATHRAFVTTQYGEGAEAAFHEIGRLDSPVVLEGFYAQLAEQSASEAVAAKERAFDAEARARLRESEKEELTRLRNEKAEKRRKAEKTKRRSASRPKKRGRRKRR